MTIDQAIYTAAYAAAFAQTYQQNAVSGHKFTDLDISRMAHHVAATAMLEYQRLGRPAG